MIDKNWFDLTKCKILDEDLEGEGQSIDIACENRNFQLYICTYKDHFTNPDSLTKIETSIALIENDSYIGSFIYIVLLSSKNNIPVAKIKLIFQE